MSGLPSLEAIWIKRVRGAPMNAVTSARLISGRGLEGNADQGGRRQVTLIEREVWDRLMSSLDADLDPSTRRANLMVTGVSLAHSRDRVLRIGDCLLRIRGETLPCRRMSESVAELEERMRADWGGGAFAEVLTDGEIHVGDPVAWED